MTADKLLSIAREQLGVTEFPPSSNKVLYNTAYYGREVSGSKYPWCAVFIWWLFREAGASRLYYGGEKTAYCPTLLSYHMVRAQGVESDYKPGDVIFFNFDGKTNAQHVGLCEAWDGETITTIDGNTGTGNEANGGAVMRRRRNKKYIVGAYRPDYAKEETMSYETFLTYMRRYEQERAEQAPSKWADPILNEAKQSGITDGSRPYSYATREEAAAMALAASKKK